MKFRHNGGGFNYLPTLCRLKLKVMSFGNAAMEIWQVEQTKIRDTDQAFVEMVLERWETVDGWDPVFAEMELQEEVEEAGLLDLYEMSLKLLEDRARCFF
ncbi:hypothetical protein CPB85DRAFT_1435671 [Mucidula mucida]|nr:hypothetical protein CPB85DRAFT_1435671 [Mucidula mucida]